MLSIKDEATKPDIVVESEPYGFDDSLNVFGQASIDLHITVPRMCSIPSKKKAL